MEERLSNKKKRIIRLIAIGVFLSIPLGIYLFIVSEHRSSKKIYQESLELLREVKVPANIDALSSQLSPFNHTKQERFKELLDYSRSWAIPENYINYKNLKIQEALNERQISWLTDVIISMNMDELKLLLKSGSLTNTALGWALFNAKDPALIDPGMVYRYNYPNQANTYAITEYLAVEYLHTGETEALISWRNTNVQVDTIIEILLKTDCIKKIDALLVRHQVLNPNSRVISLKIIDCKNILGSAFKTDAFFLGPMNAESDRFEDRYKGYGLNYFDKTCVYMWGYLDLAETNAYYNNVLNIINGKSTQSIDSLTPRIHTKGSPMSYLYIGHQMRAYRAALASNARQRMCQIAMHVIKHFQNNNTLPSQISTIDPVISRLSLGDNLSYKIKFNKVNDHCFSLYVDNTHLPNSMTKSDIPPKPSGIITTCVEIDSHSIQVNCKLD